MAAPLSDVVALGANGSEVTGSKIPTTLSPTDDETNRKNMALLIHGCESSATENSLDAKTRTISRARISTPRCLRSSKRTEYRLNSDRAIAIFDRATVPNRT